MDMIEIELEIRHSLSQLVKTGDRARMKLAEEFASSNHDAHYAIRWMDGVQDKIATALLAQQTLAQIAEELTSATSSLNACTFAAVAHLVVQRLDAMIARWTPERSTSPFANIMHEADLLAQRKVREAFRALAS